jgi:two-component system response regulator TtrR
MNTSKLSLYIVDNDEGVRRSLALLLFSLGRAVQAFDSGESFLAGVDAQQCGCVILDLRMDPGMSGIEVFDQLVARRSPLVVVFLSGHGNIEQAVEQVKKGAFDWVAKPETAAIVAKIEPALQRASENAQAAQHWARLTPREKEAAPMVALGTTSKEGARLLVPECDYRTFENYRAQAFAKLKLGNAAALRGWMTRHRWLTGFDR